jgi:hypothetical protein
MKVKREVKTACGVDVKMLDTDEDGIVLYVERELQGWLILTVREFNCTKRTRLQLA